MDAVPPYTGINTIFSTSTISLYHYPHFNTSPLHHRKLYTMSNADAQYEQKNDFAEGPAGDAGDNDYASRTGQSSIPVQKDEAPVEDPIDPATADTDEQLGVYPLTYRISHSIYTNAMF
jgi:hypothetical protein